MPYIINDVVSTIKSEYHSAWKAEDWDWNSKTLTASRGVQPETEGSTVKPNDGASQPDIGVISHKSGNGASRAISCQVACCESDLSELKEYYRVRAGEEWCSRAWTGARLADGLRGACTQVNQHVAGSRHGDEDSVLSGNGGSA